jgi:hypothetical protein
VTELHSYVCGECGYDGFRASDWVSPIPVSVSYFCPLCKHLLHRADPLGEIEATEHGTPHFDEAFPDGSGVYK